MQGKSTAAVAAVLAAALSLASVCACGASRPAAPFAHGERVTLLGDSITHGGKYGTYLQLFWDLRFPGSATRILNCGVSGGTASGGLQRWENDVLPQTADRIFVMFGMNDVGHGYFERGVAPAKSESGSGAAAAKYMTNMTEIATRTLAAGKRLAVITPTPYDEYGTNYTAVARTNCNAVGLTRLAAICRSLAAERAAELVDLHAPLTSFVRGNRSFAFCRGDRVHPTAEGHIIMTAEILSQMGVSPYVAQVEIDAGAGKVLRSDDAAVSQLDADGRRVSFDYAPARLPFPTAAEYSRAAAVYPVTEKMNLEILTIKGLAPGKYAFAADGDELGRFTEKELACGINLALLQTPGAKLAMDAWEIAGELGSLQARQRGLVLVEKVAKGKGADPSNPESVISTMGKYVEEIQKKGASYAGYYKGQLEQYRKFKPREKKLRTDEDSCRVRLRTAAAKKWHATMSVTLVP